jgi:predicted  nucleic acid-binding Zn-ribbon protein
MPSVPITNSALSGRVTAVEASTGTHETRLDTVEPALDTVEADVATHETRLDTAESDITAIESDVATHETRLDTAESDITAIETAATTLTGRVTTAEGTISSHTTSLSTLSTTVSGHGTRLTTAESDINAVESDITAIETSVSNLSDAVDAAETDIDNVEADVTSLTSSVGTLSSNVTSLSGSVTTLSGTVTSLTTTVTGHGTRLTTAESNITTLQGNITTINTLNTTQNNRLTALESTDATHTAAIDDLEDQVELLTTGVDTAAQLTSILTDGDTWRAHVEANGNLKIGPNLYTTSTITTPYVAGGVIEGLGYSEAIRYGSTLSGPVSNLIWNGTRVGTETLFTYQGQQCTIRGINFHGADRESIDDGLIATPRCGTLFHLLKPVTSGLGTGKLRLEDCSFVYGTVGVKFSDAISSNNCDRTTFDKCFFDGCVTGVQVLNANGMGHYYRECHFRDCTTYIDYKAGGDLKIQGGLLAGNGTLLNFTPVSGSGLGNANGEYLVKELKIDAGVTSAKLLNIAVGRSYWMTFKYDDIHFPDNWSHATWIIAGQCTLHINRARHLYPGCIKVLGSADGNPRVIVRDSRVVSSLTTVAQLFAAGSTGSVTVTSDNNYDNLNVSTNFPQADRSVISF